MYRIWFKLKLGANELSVDCYDIASAQIIYDGLASLGYDMISQRP